MSKAFGRDINEYYNNQFPEDAYLEETTAAYDILCSKYETNDDWILKLPDDEKFELSDFGVICSNNTTKPIGSFQSLFKRWLKQQSTATVAIEVPKDQYDEVVAKLKDMGLKVVK